MSSDWMPAVFALAGSGLTGVLALAGPRWQTAAQIATADRQRREETRKNAYVGFLSAAAAYRAA